MTDSTKGFVVSYHKIMKAKGWYHFNRDPLGDWTFGEFILAYPNRGYRPTTRRQ